MTRLFLSYRTSDSAHAMRTIAERLAAHFGREQVFRDQDSLALGSRYPADIRAALRRCDVVLAVIGPHWLDARDDRGARRIDDERDWVRFELRTALELGIRVVPLLLDGAALPTPDQLPADLGALSVSTYWTIRHRTIEADLAGLIDKLDGTRTRPNPGGQFVQHNDARDGGTIYAAQGGDQVINNGQPNGRRR